MELKNIRGIGDKTLILLKEKGITDIPSLIYTIPHSYVSYKLTDFDYYGEMNVPAVVIEEVRLQKLKTATKVSFRVSIEGVVFNVTAFNMVYLKNVLKIGSEIVIVGTYDNDFKTIIATKVFLKREYKEGVIPEYNIEGITNPHFQKIVLEALNSYTPRDNIIPTEYFNKYGYKSGRELILNIHNPKTIEEASEAIKTLKYYELLVFSLKISIIRKNIEEEKKEPKNPDLDMVKTFISSIPFELTDDQKSCVNDIYKEFKSTHPMNMLLEGDVGSGKTIVSIISSYAAYTAGYQTLIMAPTEALAYQHYETFNKYLSSFGVRVELLTSSTKDKDRKVILSYLKTNDIHVIIGTHSLLNDEVVFNNLGFIVCDEQHKFGVEQRKIVREKGNKPDVLYMSATPIPRTLSLTIYGDMTLKTIHTMPSNRKRIITKIHTYKDYTDVLNFVKSEIDEGRQAYFVSPIIDENGSTDMTSVIRVKNDLETYFKGYKIGLLHGKLTSDEKEDILNKFKNGEIDILSSTTVIEVGINNPNASVMVIIDANNFGLSTLHQLRGRVGRGSDTGYCFLMINKIEAYDKLKILEETQDGFLISEEDLRLRGPGDFLGTEQSGKLKFRFADIFEDKYILNNALKDAKELMNNETVVSYYSKHLYSDNFD